MTKFIVRGDLPKDPALKIEKQLILCPGVWKKQPITAEAIKHGIENTDWTDPENLSIIYGHRDHNDYTYLGDPSPEEWLGNISIPEYLTLADGVAVEGMYADFNFYDENLSRKIAYGGVRCGISAGMKFDYRSKVIEGFTRQSVVKNPACKKAFLNLADNESLMDTVEPTFLTLEDNTITNERGIDDKINMNEEKVKELEDEKKGLEEKVAQLEKEKLEAEKLKVEPVVETAPAPATPEPKKPEIKTEDPKPEAKAPEPAPVVIEKETIKEVENNGEVVKAINNMSDKFSDEFKKLADPATAAATNPLTADSSEDETTKKLVDQYLDLHPEKRNE